jgi:hypothetical protein
MNIYFPIDLLIANWTYSQSTGHLTHNGESVGTGYSGHGAGRNNPAEENVKNVGPIPKGEYTIGPAYTDPVRGPIVMRLTPSGGQNMFGRDGFLIHGDNSKMDGSASDGCIILGPTIREQISKSTDRKLTVVG